MVFAVYFVAFALAIALLYVFQARHWYLHILAVAAGVALGMVQMPDQWKGVRFDIALGAVIIFLLVWGLGGLFTIRWHREKHA